MFDPFDQIEQAEQLEHLLDQAEAQITRYEEALETIKRHYEMADGESWEQAYREVCSIAIEVLS